MYLTLLLLATSLSHPCLCLHLANDEIYVKPECIPDRAGALNNAKQKKSSIWIFHTTHHAGTYLWELALENGWHVAEADDCGYNGKHHPCSLKAEELQDRALYYNCVCGEDGMIGVDNLAESFPCSSDKLVMITSVRHPILRILADGAGYPENPDTDDCGTDNYGLRKLIGKEFGVPITQADVELAKARLSAFHIVIDSDNMGNSLPAMCDMLGWTCSMDALNLIDQGHAAKLVAFQQDHPNIYKKWIKRNAPEMELYEHARHHWSQRFFKRSNISTKTLDGMPKGLETVYGTAEKTSWACGGRATNGFAEAPSRADESSGGPRGEMGPDLEGHGTS